MSANTNRYAVGAWFLDGVRQMLNETARDCDLEIGDMTKGQMADYADTFRKISSYSRRMERELRREASTSFY